MIAKSFSKLSLFTAVLALGLGAACSKKAPSDADGKVTIEWWHSMAGHNNKVVDELVAKFNASQDKYKVVATFRGGYDEALNSLVAAFRGGKQPHIAQVYEGGTLQMMQSGATLPVYKLLEDNGYKVDWADYLDPIRSYYWDNNRNLTSMPFNSSTPLMYINLKRLKAAGFTKVPETWEDLIKFLDKDVSLGNKCGLIVSWHTWVLFENFNAIHDRPFATKANGFKGLDAELVYNNPEQIALIKKLAERVKTGAFTYDGRGSDAARNGFISEKCSVMMESTSALKGVIEQAKFEWQPAMLPHEANAKVVKNAIIGGATLWVLKGKPEAEYQAVAAFIDYLAKPEQQVWWHKNTGYMPLSKTAYNQLKAEGYYKENPGHEVAVLQLLRGGAPSDNSMGVRLGMFPQVRDTLMDELEKIFGGKATVEEGLKAAVDRGNQVLRRFEKTVTK
ncbi:MAG TPA: sn-glycerol-3-phosphate ABC transporter substrate-binding protein UgpB [Bdellovibrionota bacterium]|jgi:sn-glycerol 3-phosphate transport system substrate-binding protein|nr:sn-glycerol-3-phosphate ABC transporter substrate-binding protein UgpB [Bdellovibrionota bacterium]